MKRLSRAGLSVILPAVAAASAALAAVPLAYADHPAGSEPTGQEAAHVINSRAGGACDAAWREEFTEAQGRSPNERDCRDRYWSLLFTQLRGRTPTDDDWKVHFYNNDGVFWDWREAPPLPIRLGKFGEDPRLPHLKSG